jgi:hypothetical protein
MSDMQPATISNGVLAMKIDYQSTLLYSFDAPLSQDALQEQKALTFRLHRVYIVYCAVFVFGSGRAFLKQHYMPLLYTPKA